MLSKFWNLLISRSFAIFLFIVSTIILILFKGDKENFSPFYLISPLLVFLSIIFCTSNRIKSYTGKWSVLFKASLIFHLGLIVLIVSASLSVLIKYHVSISVPQGITRNLLNEESVTFHSEPLFAKPPLLTIRLDNLVSEFVDGKYSVGREATLTLGSEDDGIYKYETKTVSINKPIKFNFYNILLTNGGMSPLFVIRNAEGKVVYKRFVNVSNSTAIEDYVEIANTSVKIYTRYFPDLVKTESGYSTKTLLNNNPAFGIRIVSDNAPFTNMYAGVLKIGGKAKFSGGLTFEIEDLKPFIEVVIIRDLTYYSVFVGLLLTFIGLIVRFYRFDGLRLEDKIEHND